MPTQPGENGRHHETATLFSAHPRCDVSIAKNHLTNFELGPMRCILSAYLGMAEMQAARKVPMPLEDWEKRLSGFLQLWDRETLQVTAERAEVHAESEFEKYRFGQDRPFGSDFDKMIKQRPERGGSP